MSELDTERKVPLILIAVGLLLYTIAAFIQKGTASPFLILLVVLIGAAIETVLLIAAAFLVAALFKVSFGDVRSAVLKFAGAVLLSGGLAAVVPWGGIISIFVFIGLVIWLFELETVYVVILTIVYFVLTFALAAALGAFFSRT